jgi:hypothetical protein
MAKECTVGEVHVVKLLQLWHALQSRVPVGIWFTTMFLPPPVPTVPGVPPPWQLVHAAVGAVVWAPVAPRKVVKPLVLLAVWQVSHAAVVTIWLVGLTFTPEKLVFVS